MATRDLFCCDEGFQHIHCDIFFVSVQRTYITSISKTKANTIVYRRQKNIRDHKELKSNLLPAYIIALRYVNYLGYLTYGFIALLKFVTV